MTKNTFVTETDVQYLQSQSSRVMVVIFVVISALACLGFLIAWQTFVFFELIVLISCGVTVVYSKKSSQSWKLEFEDDRLTITNQKNGKKSVICGVSASVFIMNQTRKEKELDYGSVGIRFTAFAFGGVKNYQALKQYIFENFH